MNTKVKQILIGIISGASFILFYVGIQLDLIYAILLTLLVYGGLFLFTTYKPQKEEEKIAILEQCEEKLAKASQIAQKIMVKKVKTEIQDICKLGNQILQNLEKDKNLVKLIGNSMIFYLDTLLKISSNYLTLSSQEVKTEKVEAILTKIENSLSHIKKNFEKYLTRSVEDDLIELDSELSVLEETSMLEEEK